VLRNTHGMVARIITYGAILTELQAPDRTGALTNVVLGADRFDVYLRGFPASAAIIGRYANRIAKARFSLHGVEYKLAANNGPNHIHGGNRGFAQVVWMAKALPVGDHSAAVELSYASKDGEEGYPGNLHATITYTLTDDNELRLDYTGTTDKATPINLTSHAYFNLAGFGDVLGHRLWLAANKYTLVDGQLIPTGEMASVKDTPLDFTTPALIGARIAQLKPSFGGYDHNYVLDNERQALVLAARVTEPDSGRIMELRTTQPGVQLYTANHLGGRGGPGQPGYPKYGAFCLETQHYPDSVHRPSFPSTILEPGETFRSTTVFSFSAK
jgi:aldose 1-epimerase